jgi:DNA-binding response OmpR family regulator
VRNSRRLGIRNIGFEVTDVVVDAIWRPSQVDSVEASELNPDATQVWDLEKFLSERLFVQGTIEFNLLTLLLENIGKPQSREEIIVKMQARFDKEIKVKALPQKLTVIRKKLASCRCGLELPPGNAHNPAICLTRNRTTTI